MEKYLSDFQRNIEVYKASLDEKTKTRNKIIFTICLTTIIVISIFFNSLSLYFYSKLKKKIMADHIKAQIFVINLVFTLIAMPYYILKETETLKSVQVCKSLYFVTDFIMNVYNNCLILIAIDRFFFICTQIRYKPKSLFKPFYVVTFLMAIPILSRLLADDCTNFGFQADNNDHHDNSSSPISQKTAQIDDYHTHYRKLVLLFYNYFIILEMSVCWLVTTILYLAVIRYVYLNSFILARFKSRENRIDLKNIPLVVAKVSKTNSTDNNTHNEPNLNQINLELINNQKDDLNQEETGFFTNLKQSPLSMANFKKTKNWKITKTFIKVNN